MVIIDLMREVTTLNVINRSTSVIVELSVIVKIHKYRRLHEGHHFILITMEVHNTFEHDMDHFIKECAYVFHDRRSRGHLSLFFCNQFFKQCVNIAFQHALAFAINKKILLAGDVCSKPPILYINSVSLSVCLSVEVMKPRSLLIKLSPRTRGPKNYSRPRVFTSYFYFYVRFCAATAVVDGGSIFGIWKVGEEIWVRFFWAKGLGGS